MAQARRKRQTKHRGNAAGAIESRGRTGRKPTADEKTGNAGARSGTAKKETRLERLERPPTWRGAFYRAMAAAVVMLLISIVLLKKPNEAVALFPIVLLAYIPISYYTDMWLYRRRMASKSRAKASGKASVK